jgi:hypothetical protein
MMNIFGPVRASQLALAVKTDGDMTMLKINEFLACQQRTGRRRCLKALDQNGGGSDELHCGRRLMIS